MLNQAASFDEILEGYPALDREKIELAPLYIQATGRSIRSDRREGKILFEAHRCLDVTWSNRSMLP